MISKARVDMGYIKLILLLNIGLIFAIKIKNFSYHGLDTKEILDKHLDKDIINLPDNVYPTHYKVQLTVKRSYPIIYLWGQVDINITIVSNNIQTLLLHAKNIVLDNFATRLRSTKGTYLVDESDTIQDEFLAIKFLLKVPSDNYTLTVVFNATANQLFRDELPHTNATIEQKNELILSQFGKTAARQLFPCWDEPAYKATFDIEITHEAEYTVLSNMPISETYDNNDYTDTRMKCTKFITTPMISTHQLVILLMPSNSIVDLRGNVHMWCKFNRTSFISFIHKTVNSISNHLLEYTQMPLEIQKIDHVLVPNAPYSEAHLGLIIYRESDVIYDETKDTIDVKIDAKNIIEYQVARQWFGGIITPKFWNHSWLTESFALYFSHYSSKQVNLEEEMPKWDSENFDKAVQLNIINNYFDVMRKDTGSMPPVLSESSELTSDVYHKGAFILRMLRGVLTEAKFREIVIEYLNKHKYGVVTSDDLWSILHNVKDSEDDLKFVFSEVKSIKDVMESWITQKGFPIIEVWQNNDDLLRLTQKSSTFNKRNHKWWIPVTYMTATDVAHNQSRLTFPFRWLKPTETLFLEIANFSKIEHNWYIINVGQVGYYRVRYAYDNWMRLGQFLKSENYSRIPAFNRAQLIADICHEFRNKQVDWHLFEHVTSYLSQETDYIPWVPMLKCLDMLTEFFRLPETKWHQMQIANYFASILDEVGYEDDPYDDDIRKTTRKNIIFYACTFGNSACTSAANSKLKEYFLDFYLQYKILPWWQYWRFCFGLKTVTKRKYVSVWELIYTYYKETRKKIILNSLTCVEDSSFLIDRFFNRIMHNFTLKEDFDQANLFDIIIKRHINNYEFLTYIMNNIKTLKPKSISLNDAFDIIITNIYSERQLNELMMNTTDNDFNEYKIKQNDTIIRQLEKIRALKNLIIK